MATLTAPRNRRPATGRPPRDLAIFLGGIAVIGLHVVDDSFLQPQPGTSAGDRLVSGLVPLAVLAIAAASYSRLRPGGARRGRAGGRLLRGRLR